MSPELPVDPTLEMQRATELRSTSNPVTIGMNDQNRRNPLQIPGGSTNVDYQAELDDFSDEEDSEDDDEEPLIIQLMESMFTRKKTVQESEQMISEISVEEIR